MKDVPGNFGYYSADFRKQSRLASLYSDFTTQKSSNPDGYKANCEAWLAVLEDSARDLLLPPQRDGQPDRYVLHNSQKLATFAQSSRYGQPLALDEAVACGVEQGRLLPLDEFLKASVSVYQKSELPSAWQIISWGLSKAGMTGRRSITHDTVIIRNLEESSQQIRKHSERFVISNATSIFTRSSFLQEFDSVFTSTKVFTDVDFDVLMKFLSRDQQLIAYDQQSGTIKFSVRSATTPEPITQEDKDIASLRTLIMIMSQQVAQLTKRAEEFDATLRKAIIAKKNIAAKSALRSRKLTESSLQQRTGTLHQLEDVFSKIKQAADQVEIVRVMEAAGRTLRALNDKTGGIDKIQDVMEDLKEQAMNTDEIARALNEDSNNVIDEGEVEDELAELEQAEAAKVAQVEQSTKDAQLEREAEEISQKLAALESPSKAAFRQEHKDTNNALAETG